MKKLCVFLLVLCLICSFAVLTGCNGNENTESESVSESATRPEYPSHSETSSETESQKGTESESESIQESETPGESETPTETESETIHETETPAPPVGENDFTEVNETVYVTAEQLVLRATPSATAEIKGYLLFGKSVRRVGYHSVWSKVEYKGATYYTLTKYLTTTNFTGSDFTPLEEASTMYVNVEKASVRLYPSTESYATIKGLVSLGDEITCVATNGSWYRVIFKDSQLYISASCLSASRPGEDHTLDGFTMYEAPVTMYVIAETLNIRIAPSADKDSTIVGALAKDKPVVCYGDNGSWCVIEFGGKQCFVKLEYLSETLGGNTTPDVEPETEAPYDDSEFTKFETPITMYVTASSLNIRKAPNTKPESLTGAAFVKDDAVTCIGFFDGWYQIIYNGEIRYVGGAYLDEEKPLPLQ